MLLYGQANTKLTINNCTFNDNGGLNVKKAAVEIGNDYGSSYVLIVNNTVVNGLQSITRVSILALLFGLIKTQWEKINSLLLLTVKSLLKVYY